MIDQLSHQKRDNDLHDDFARDQERGENRCAPELADAFCESLDQADSSFLLLRECRELIFLTTAGTEISYLMEVKESIPLYLQTFIITSSVKEKIGGHC